MGTHSQVIIAAPNLNRPLAPSVFQRVWKLASVAIDLLKNAIRMVHFLLQYLALEEVLVLETVI